MLEKNIATTKIAIFKGKKVRKTIYNNEWWFVIIDVVEALTDSVQPDGYIKDMRRRDSELSKGWGQIATPLIVQTEGGQQKVNCANTEGIFRIIQSIPSSKFELIFTMLGERSTTEIHRQENSQGAPKLKKDANRGGRIAGNARKELEKELGRSVVSEKNYLGGGDKIKKLK